MGRQVSVMLPEHAAAHHNMQIHNLRFCVLSVDANGFTSLLNNLSIGLLILYYNCNLRFIFTNTYYSSFSSKLRLYLDP